MAHRVFPPWLKNFFQNKNGNLVIWQFPNPPLLAGSLAAVLTRVIQDTNLIASLKALSTAFFFTWAYLELRYGESMFRRTLGVLVLALIVVSYFSDSPLAH